MLNSVDRILVAVRDLDQAEQNYREVLGAQYLDELASDHLNARGRSLVIGESTVELWTPRGAGVVSDHLDSFGEGLFFGGVSTASLAECQRFLAEQGIRFAEADGRLYLNAGGLYGMPLVVSEAAARVRANVLCRFCTSSPWFSAPTGEKSRIATRENWACSATRQ